MKNTLTHLAPSLTRKQKVVHSHSPAFHRNVLTHPQFTTEPGWNQIPGVR